MSITINKAAFQIWIALSALLLIVATASNPAVAEDTGSLVLFDSSDIYIDESYTDQLVYGSPSSDAMRAQVPDDERIDYESVTGTFGLIVMVYCAAYALEKSGEPEYNPDELLTAIKALTPEQKQFHHECFVGEYSRFDGMNYIEASALLKSVLEQEKADAEHLYDWASALMEKLEEQGDQ